MVQLEARKKELHVQKEEYNRLQQEMSKSTSQWKKKLGERQSGEQAALRQLNEAQNHIFRMQPRRNDITDTEAHDQVSDLYNGIHRWVESRLDKILEMLDNRQLGNLSYPRDAAKRFLTLVSPRAMRSMRYDRSDEYLITSVIFRYLCKTFFSRPFYCPLTGPDNQVDAINLIDRIEKSMSLVPRGSYYAFGLTIL